jgi:hypothetical protein
MRPETLHLTPDPSTAARLQKTLPVAQQRREMTKPHNIQTEQESTGYGEHEMGEPVYTQP